ncbi:hypothetical protein M405DRAFT_641829 [Rhizopogon salebrosus TDB-379]|nr:hypothetical protein M405DRAFT_641829 [Rhizopogon salebrosus TDB-379]
MSFAVPCPMCSDPSTLLIYSCMPTRSHSPQHSPRPFSLARAFTPHLEHIYTRTRTHSLHPAMYPALSETATSDPSQSRRQGPHLAEHKASKSSSHIIYASPSRAQHDSDRDTVCSPLEPEEEHRPVSMMLHELDALKRRKRARSRRRESGSKRTRQELG